MSATIRYFGVRHHGPGCTRELLRALDELTPTKVLIEGPVDASESLPALADPAMKPPVALLAYRDGAPEHAGFWPMAEFSPEYQAVRWALRNKASVEFIDLPASAMPEAPGEQELAEPSRTPQEELAAQARRDPIGLLAKVAGYEDGESWWAELIEENPDPGPVFDAIDQAMTALREKSDAELSQREAQREAHMRLQIAKAQKSATGAIAVVCGAWHVPALKAARPLKEDRELLKSLRKAKIKATWVPWTLQRLSWQSGYGAGVTAPGWCRHLWAHSSDRAALLWLGRIAQELRRLDFTTSTASLIEADRLARSLACIREKSRPGFEELREATIACLCHGDPTRWQLIEKTLLIGSAVGEIPEVLDQAPLLGDLAKQQKSMRLRPAADAKEISLDLRSAAGLKKSTLLHRLTILGVPWGQLSDAGRSRGTFRERWILQWQPEYAVELVENTVYGQSIEKAAQQRLITELGRSDDLGFLARSVRKSMLAQLPKSTQAGLDRLSRCAATNAEGLAMLQAISPLADLLRYGEAREFNPEQMQQLVEQIAIQASIALGHAAKALNDEASGELGAALSEADAALHLIEIQETVMQRWRNSLQALLDEGDKDPRVTGVAAQRLYVNSEMNAEQAAQWLAHALSPALPVAHATASFEGFFKGIAVRLVHDHSLRSAVHQWFVALEEESFIQTLPLFRRVFSDLDSSERKHLLRRLLEGERQREQIEQPEHLQEYWKRHQRTVLEILNHAPQGA